MAKRKEVVFAAGYNGMMVATSDDDGSKESPTGFKV